MLPHRSAVSRLALPILIALPASVAAAAFLTDAVSAGRLTRSSSAFASVLPLVSLASAHPNLSPSSATSAGGKSCLSSSPYSYGSESAMPKEDASSSASAAAAAGMPRWYQHEISITAPSRGCHLITGEVQKAIGSDLSGIKVGLCNLFIQHTSASLTVNENADPDVRRDLEEALNKIVPASWNRDGTFRHTMEGDDDMPGHVKSSLMGPSLTIPIRNGRLALGTWQGIYLNEHRDQGGWGGGHNRKIVITLQGQS